MQKEIVSENDRGTRIDQFLAARTDLTRSAAHRLIESGLVSVNGAPVSKSFRVSVGEEVCFDAPEPTEADAQPENIPLDIVYEDEDIIVINKPKGMVVHPAAGNPSGTLVNALLYHCGDSLSGIGGVVRPGIVHRIDKDTTGLLVAAKNDAAHVFLSDLLKTHDIRRTYYAIINGTFKEDGGTVTAPIARHPKDRKRMAVAAPGSAGAKDAVTHFEVLERFRSFSLLRLELETGRTHQIRVHMAHRGHPILGDTVYGGGKTAFEKQNAPLIEGQCLHAGELRLVHPRSGEEMTFRAPLPAAFEALLEKLRRQSQ